MLKYNRGTESQGINISATDNYTTQGLYTFSMRLGGNGRAPFIKTTNIVADSPSSLLITFTNGELDSLPTGIYRMELYAIKTSDSSTELVTTEPFHISPGLLT